MRPRSVALLTGSAALVALTVAGIVLRESLATAWRERRARTALGHLREAAIRDLGRPGCVHSIPWLVEECLSPAGFKDAAIEAIARIGGAGPATLVRAEMDKTGELSFRTLKGLLAGGAGPSGVLPEVLAWLRRSEGPARREALCAIEALGTHGETAMADLVRLFGSVDEETGAILARVVGAVWTGSRESALVVMEIAAHGEEPARRASAVLALGAMSVARDDETTGTAVLGALQDSMDEVRAAACRAAGGLRAPLRTAAIGELGRIAMVDPAPRARAAAAWGLSHAAESDGSAATALVAALGQPAQDLSRESVVRALWDLVGRAPEAEPALRGVLAGDPSDRCRRAALDGLLFSGRLDREAGISIALAAVNDPSERVRSQALWYLKSLRPGPRVLDALVRALDDASESVADEAARNLRYLGPEAVDSVGALGRALLRGRPAAGEVARSLEVILGPSTQLVDIMVRGVVEGDETCAAACGEVLARSGPASAQAIPALRRAAAARQGPGRATIEAAIEAIQRAEASSGDGKRDPGLPPAIGSEE